MAVVGAELVLRVAAPLPDPLGRLKRSTPPYTPISQPRSARVAVEVEPGLNGLEPRAVFTTNDLGFRGAPIEQPKPPGERRVFLIGGSTAECLVMSDRDSLESRLQSFLGRTGKNVRVFNAGKSGATSADHLAILTQRVLHLEPIGGVDALKMFATELQLVRRYYALRYPGLMVEAALDSGGTMATNYRFGAELCRSMPATEEEPPMDLGQYERNLRSMIGAARANHVAIALMTQVSSWAATDADKFGIVYWMPCLKGKRYSPQTLAAALEAHNNVTRRVAADSGVTLIDLAKLLPNTAEFFYDDCHFNPKGSDAAAMLAGQAIETSTKAP